MRVLLYPWFGSKPKHYIKYSEMYKNIYGTSTIIDIVPYSIKDAVTYTRWKKQRAGYLTEPIKHKNYDCLHMISGGALVAHNHLNYYNDIQSTHTIFDSGPFWPDSNMESNYFCEMTGMSSKLADPLSALIKYYFKIIEGMPYDEEQIKYNNWINTHTNSLFLLNRNDRLLFINQIDRLVENTSSTLVHIDAPHARLIESKKYKENIEKYLNEGAK